MSRCDANKGSLTVFFEEPFWIGVFEAGKEKGKETRTLKERR